MKDKDENHVEVLAMLDSGSNSSFISKNVIRKLGLSGPNKSTLNHEFGWRTEEVRRIRAYYFNSSVNF